MMRKSLVLFLGVLCLGMIGCGSYPNNSYLIGEFEYHAKNKATITLKFNEMQEFPYPPKKIRNQVRRIIGRDIIYPRFAYFGISDEGILLRIDKFKYHCTRRNKAVYSHLRETMNPYSKEEMVFVKTHLGIYCYSIIEATQDHVILLYRGNCDFYPYVNVYLEKMAELNKPVPPPVELGESWIEGESK